MAVPTVSCFEKNEKEMEGKWKVRFHFLALVLFHGLRAIAIWAECHYVSDMDLDA